MSEQFETRTCLEMTARIVAAYVSRNPVGMPDLPGVISSVADGFAALSAKADGSSKAKLKPAVPVRRSVGMNHITCLACGKRHKMLRRHLAAAHGLTPSAYREMFRLESHYPMTAPTYARVRSEIAKRIGLGRREKPATRHKKASPRKHAA